MPPTPPDSTIPTHRHGPVTAAVCVGMVVAAFIAFYPALTAGFSEFDDPGVLWEDRGWQGLGPRNIEWMFSTFRLGHFQPLSYLSFALEWTLFGMGPGPDKANPVVFHATNILLHGLNAGVLWLVLRRILAAIAGKSEPDAPASSQGWIAGIAALLWAVHPLRAESVAWITERRDVLSTFFLLLTTLIYLKTFPVGSTRPKSLSSYAFAVALLALSLLSKAWGMTFFVVATLLDIYPLRRLPIEPWRWFNAGSIRVLLEKIPFAALGVAFAFIAAKAQSSSHQTVKTLVEWGVAERLAQACYGLVFYVQKTLAPLRLCALYELPRSIKLTDPTWLIPIALVALATIGVLVIARKRPGIAIAFIAYAVLVAPVLGILQSGIQLVADRYSYVSTIPLFALVAWGVLAAVNASKNPRGSLANVRGAGVVLVGLAALLTWPQASLWRNTLVLWKHCIDLGHDGPLTRTFYANQVAALAQSTTDIVRQQQLKSEAIEQYRKAVEQDDAQEGAWYGLGCLLRDVGRPAEAEPAFLQAIEHTTVKSKPRVALGMLYLRQLDRPALARDQLEQAVKDIEAESKVVPTGIPYLMLAGARDMTGDSKGAYEMLQKAATFPDTKAAAEDHLRDYKPSK